MVGDDGEHMTTPLIYEGYALDRKKVAAGITKTYPRVHKDMVSMFEGVVFKDSGRFNTSLNVGGVNVVVCGKGVRIYDVGSSLEAQYVAIMAILSYKVIKPLYMRCIVFGEEEGVERFYTADSYL